MRFVNNVKTAGLLGSLIALCMLIGHYTLGPNGMLFGLLLGGGGAIFSYLFSDKIAMASMGGQEVSREQIPWLFDMVEQLAGRAGLPMPRIYVCPQAAPNAFATGRSPRKAAVAISQGMLRHFPKHEIAGVMAHELAHVKNYDTMTMAVAATIGGAISMLAQYLQFGALFGGNRNNNSVGWIGMLVAIIVAPMAAMLVQMAVSRSREYQADRMGGQICGNPRWLASALQKIEGFARGIRNEPAEAAPATAHLFIINPLTGEGMDNLFSTHPNTANRIAALERLAAEMGPGPSRVGTRSAAYDRGPSSPSGPWGGGGAASGPRGPWG